MARATMTANRGVLVPLGLLEQHLLAPTKGTHIMMPMQNRPPVVARRKGNRLWIRSVTFAGMMLGATVAYAVVG